MNNLEERIDALEDRIKIHAMQIQALTDVIRSQVPLSDLLSEALFRLKERQQELDRLTQ